MSVVKLITILLLDQLVCFTSLDVTTGFFCHKLIVFCFHQLDADAANILKELQQKLNGVLDELSNIFAKSLEPQIQQSMQELGALLSKVKGTGQVSLSQPSQRTTIQQESDMVLRPLMDLLDGRYGRKSVENVNICHGYIECVFLL